MEELEAGTAQFQEEERAWTKMFKHERSWSSMVQ